MKTYSLKLAAAALVIAGLFATIQLIGERQAENTAAISSLGDVQSLLSTYDRWKAKATQVGGDRNLVLPLGYSKGLSAQFTKARGQAFLDLVGGTVSVEVSGFPEEQALDVWLIDNRPGPGHSVKPEPGDAMVRLGRLKHAGGRAALEARLGPEAITGFEIDLVVVARAGEDPGKASLLFGSPTLFQRLYHSELREQFARRGEVGASRSSDPADQSLLAAPFRVLIPSPAYAQHTKGKPDLRLLIAKGQDIFDNETFRGNGRTCATCHPAENNFTIDREFIATLPPDDPLFVAEFIDALNSQKNGGEVFENPTLMREFGLIVENQDGFGDLQNNFNMRGVPHTLALSVSVDSALGPRTGWSGDGAPGSGSLREFATGAVIQHFTKTLNRVAGVDFRLPTDKELDALEAFQLSLGRQADLTLPLPLTDTIASRGQEIFLDPTTGKCFACHSNGGANGDPNVFGPGVGNLNFNTGVEDLPDQPADLTGELVPEDDGFGTPGDGTFNTPPVVEAADTGPFFHNNAITTIEGSVAFYNGNAFNNSPAGQLLRGATGSGINLDGTQVDAVAAFLRAINALDNIESSIALLERARYARGYTARSRIRLAKADIEDAIDVLRAGGLHPGAVKHLEQARVLTENAAKQLFIRGFLIKKAIAQQKAARGHMVKMAK